MITGLDLQTLIASIQSFCQDSRLADSVSVWASPSLTAKLWTFLRAEDSRVAWRLVS